MMTPARNRPPVRVLAAIPHFYGAGGVSIGSSLDDRATRAATVTRCITNLHEHFSPSYEVFPRHRQPFTPVGSVVVKLVTSGDQHLVDDLVGCSTLFEHEPTDVEPRFLPFECQRVLARGLGDFDFYCYVEDDILIADPLLFVKLAWFIERFGDDALLIPNRFERHGGLTVAPDGPLSDDETAAFQDRSDRPEVRAATLGIDVVFRRPSNPNAGCYFLSATQLERWASKPSFGVPTADFIAAIESGANLGIMQTFRVYKPAEPTADFLEVEHGTHRYLDQWGIPGPLHTVSAAYLHAVAERTAARAAYASLLRSPTFRLTAPLRRAVRSVRPRRRPL